MELLKFAVLCSTILLFSEICHSREIPRDSLNSNYRTKRSPTTCPKSKTNCLAQPGTPCAHATPPIAVRRPGLVIPALFAEQYSFQPHVPAKNNACQKPQRCEKPCPNQIPCPKICGSTPKPCEGFISPPTPVVESKCPEVCDPNPCDSICEPNTFAINKCNDVMKNPCTGFIAPPEPCSQLISPWKALTETGKCEVKCPDPCDNIQITNCPQTCSETDQVCDDKTKVIDSVCQKSVEVKSVCSKVTTASETCLFEEKDCSDNFEDCCNDKEGSNINKGICFDNDSDGCENHASDLEIKIDMNNPGCGNIGINYHDAQSWYYNNDGHEKPIKVSESPSQFYPTNLLPSVPTPKECNKNTKPASNCRDYSKINKSDRVGLDVNASGCPKTTSGCNSTPQTQSNCGGVSNLPMYTKPYM